MRKSIRKSNRFGHRGGRVHPPYGMLGLRDWLSPSVLVLSLLMCCSCGDDQSTDLLKGQNNATLIFFGFAVDQDNRPLPGAHFEFSIESFPKDWSFETRGQKQDRSTQKAVSDEAGRFQFEITGCSLFLKSVVRPGYRHLTPLLSNDTNVGYTLIAASDLWYKSDPDNPAVYVFVRDGVKEVSALPSRGGFDSGGGTVWRRNEPAWPKKPSLPDVVYKPPTTQPASTQAGQDR